MNKITYDKFCCMREEELNEIIKDASEKQQNDFKTYFCFFKKSLKTCVIDVTIESDIAMETDTAEDTVILEKSVESSSGEPNVNIEKTSTCYTVVDDTGFNEELDIEPNVENIAKLDNYDFYYPQRKLMFIFFTNI